MPLGIASARTQRQRTYWAMLVAGDYELRPGKGKRDMEPLVAVKRGALLPQAGPNPATAKSSTRPMLQAVRKVLPGRRPHVLDRASRAGTLFSRRVLVANGAQLALCGRS